MVPEYGPKGSEVRALSFDRVYKCSQIKTKAEIQGSCNYTEP